MNEAIAVLTQQGAVVIDPADIPSVVSTDLKGNFLRWPACGGLGQAKGKDADCSVVQKYGMKRDFNKWLASLGATAPVKTLTELREWNLRHQKAGAIKYGQARLDISDEMDVEADRARYQADREQDQLLSATQGIDSVMTQRELDALLFPGSSGAAIAARPGYPTMIVPFGLVPNAPVPSFPAAFNAKPAPYGVSFSGTACSEPRLIELAYAFEAGHEAARGAAIGAVEQFSLKCSEPFNAKDAKGAKNAKLLMPLATFASFAAIAFQNDVMQTAVEPTRRVGSAPGEVPLRLSSGRFNRRPYVACLPVSDEKLAVTGARRCNICSFPTAKMGIPSYDAVTSLEAIGSYVRRETVLVSSLSGWSFLGSITMT